MVRSLVIDAIERQLVSDFEICSFLSGGLDSTIITTVAAKALKRECKTLKTFSIDYKENKRYYTFNMFQPTLDTDFAKIASKEIGTEHTIIEIDNDLLSESLYQATVANDLPGMADIDSSLLLFTKEVRKYAKVALSGECGDEIFGGYPWYWNSIYKDVSTFPWSPSLDFRLKLLSQKYSKDELKEYVNSKYQQSISKIILPESDRKKN
ncbi:asparagine synthase C-terminal domain-containing protein [Caldicellulosiruptor naganoensis]|uniref:asparagine synthase (glutamine-hydrolyzing) n=1 Tax=Caldicellulosiruptor naganoensis TaxID=29324 RepID=A0ABY7BM64_9FIRM|nr:asparagine synthase C-terminal domain-containing protein [Caldicellulosiruptor naganoensis]